MSKRRTYIDANLLIAAWGGQEEMVEKALTVLDDPERCLVVSDALWMEVFPKAVYHRNQQELAFYESVFEGAEYHPWRLEVLGLAKKLAQSYGLAAMDAIHVATAITADVDEFVSAEKPTKPMFRVTEIQVCSLRELG
jgi:predicted nucleic acid-binding protein